MRGPIYSMFYSDSGLDWISLGDQLFNDSDAQLQFLVVNTGHMNPPESPVNIDAFEIRALGE